MSDTFEIHGYTIEVYVHNKLKGNYVVQEPDRDEMGYGGRKTQILDTDVVLSNKRIIKAGTKVMTECSPICGRAKNPLVWTVDATNYSNNALVDLLESNENFTKSVGQANTWTDVILLISAKLKLKCNDQQFEYLQKWWSNKYKNQ